MVSSFLLLSTLNVAGFFIFINHPLAIGLTLLIQTCLVAFLTGCLRTSFWFSYILFLVFLGGILVLFIYITRLASNEIFSLSYIMISLIPFFLIRFLLCRLSLQVFDWVLPYASSTSMFDSESTKIIMESLILKLYNSLTYHLTILLACYLLLTLIVVVNITRLNQGPLRTHMIYVQTNPATTPSF